MMRLEVVPVPESQKPALWEMVQAYIAELSVYAGVEPTDGAYEYKPFDLYWREDGRFPFWARMNGWEAGFALVWRDCGHDLFRMAEFYVVPEFRRAGLAMEFARAVIEQFHGRWKVRQIARNTPAVAFWRKALAPYNYTEESFEDRGLARWEQSFMIGP